MVCEELINLKAMESAANNTGSSDSSFPNSMDVVQDNIAYCKPTDKQILDGVERFRTIHHKYSLAAENIQSLALDIVGNGHEENLNAALGNFYGISKNYAAYQQVTIIIYILQLLQP